MLIIKRILCLLLCLGLMAGTIPIALGAGPQVSAQAAVLMTGDGELLYDKNGESRALIASTTKLMTALVASRLAKPDELVEIQGEDCGLEGSSMYLSPGERYTVRELLLGLLLVSGNDAAAALARHVAGGLDSFAGLMNETAKDLGMKDSSFTNPHGLDDPGHRSTAWDLAKLMAACLEEPGLREIMETKSCHIKGRTLVNHNRLLWTLEGCTGGKTGYTQAAGRCLVSACSRGSLELICVTLNAPKDWEDHALLYQWAYGQCDLIDPAQGWNYQIPVVSGKGDSVTVEAQGMEPVYILPGSKIELRASLPPFIFAPVKKGERAGELRLIINGRETGSCPLVYRDTVGPEGPLEDPI